MSKRVLIIEDNDDNRNLYSMMLAYAGYDVLAAADGHAGLQTAIEAKPELVLLDIGLPGLSGWAVCEILKSRAEMADTKVIAITAHTFPEDRERAISMCMEGFLAKPVEPREVLAEVKRVIGDP
jgi:CheY-like chemotaxis protein